TVPFQLVFAGGEREVQLPARLQRLPGFQPLPDPVLDRLGDFLLGDNPAVAEVERQLGHPNLLRRVSSRAAGRATASASARPLARGSARVRSLVPAATVSPLGSRVGSRAAAAPARARALAPG